ncbi:MAG: hypothetical protein ACFE7S_06300 [Candidatus Hodarchaeota archaeon]
MSNRKTIARIVVVVWFAFLATSLIIYFVPLLPISLYITENLWVLAVILIPFIIVVAQSAFPKDEEEDATVINLFENSETNLSESTILELPPGKEPTNRTSATSVAIDESSQSSSTKEGPSPEEEASRRTKTISEVETEKDAVLSLLEGLEKQSTEGKISPETYQLLKQKYRDRLEDLTNRTGKLKSNQS